MLKIATIALAALLTAAPAQADPWKNTLDLGLNLTQNSYSDSWVGGEVGSVAWVANANGVFEKQVSPKFNFKNTSKLQFGQTHTQDEATKNWKKPTKSADKIDIENLGRFTLGAFVDPYAAFRIETQFYDASYELKKRALNPLLLTESAGVARKLYSFEKNEVLTRLGFSIRELINRVIVDSVAKTTESQTSNDGGIESVTDVRYTLAGNVGYIGKLSLFKALYFSKKDDFKGTPAEDYWKAVDVNFENTFSVAVAKYIAVTLNAQLLYDKQIDLRGRFKETLALGLTYKFM